MATIKLVKTDSEFLETASRKVVLTDGRTFFYCPYWFEKVSEDTYQQYSFEQLPIELIDQVLLNREK